MTELERRVAAVTATWEHFRGRPFAWDRVDCVKVGAWHIRQMGHRTKGLHKAGNYKTALGAKRALTRAGFKDLADALNANGLNEIAPAAALPGDILLAPGGEGFDALTIVAGNNMVIGFHDDALETGLQRIRIVSLGLVKAWRV